MVYSISHSEGTIERSRGVPFQPDLEFFGFCEGIPYSLPKPGTPKIGGIPWIREGKLPKGWMQTSSHPKNVYSYLSPEDKVPAYFYGEWSPTNGLPAWLWVPACKYGLHEDLAKEPLAANIGSRDPAEILPQWGRVFVGTRTKRRRSRCSSVTIYSHQYHFCPKPGLTNEEQRQVAAGLGALGDTRQGIDFTCTPYKLVPSRDDKGFPIGVRGRGEARGYQPLQRVWVQRAGMLSTVMCSSIRVINPAKVKFSGIPTESLIPHLRPQMKLAWANTRENWGSDSFMPVGPHPLIKDGAQIYYYTGDYSGSDKAWFVRLMDIPHVTSPALFTKGNFCNVFLPSEDTGQYQPVPEYSHTILKISGLKTFQLFTPTDAGWTKQAAAYIRREDASSVECRVAAVLHLLGARSANWVANPTELSAAEKQAVLQLVDRQAAGEYSFTPELAKFPYPFNLVVTPEMHREFAAFLADNGLAQYFQVPTAEPIPVFPTSVDLAKYQGSPGFVRLLLKALKNAGRVDVQLALLHYYQKTAADANTLATILSEDYGYTFHDALHLLEDGVIPNHFQELGKK